MDYIILKKNQACLSEFIEEFSDIEDLTKSIKDKTALKNIILLIAETFYKSNNYEKSAKFYQYYLDHVNANDKDIKFCLIQSLVHFDINKADSIRRQIDETEVDLSNENINNLLNELFSRFKRGEKQEKAKKKRKKKLDILKILILNIQGLCLIQKDGFLKCKRKNTKLRINLLIKVLLKNLKNRN